MNHEGKDTVKWSVNTTRGIISPNFSSPVCRHNRAALRLLWPYLPRGNLRKLPRHLCGLGHAIHAKRDQLLHRQPRLGRRLHRSLLHTLPGNSSASLTKFQHLKSEQCNDLFRLSNSHSLSLSLSLRMRKFGYFLRNCKNKSRATAALFKS